MASGPQISLRDGSGTTTSLTFTTNQEAIYVTGTVSSDTVSVQLSVNGGPFVSDPNLISFVLQTFTIPNLTVYPSGLPLEFGVNTILIRVIDIVGAVSAASTVLVTRIAQADDTGTQVPSGVRVLRNRDFVQILAAKPKPIQNLTQDDDGNFILVTQETNQFLGFNFYASTEPSGSSGYYRLNEKPVTAPIQQVEDQIDTFSDIALWDSSNAKTLRVRVSEEDEFGRELQVRLNATRNNSLINGKLKFTGTWLNYEFNAFVAFTHSRAGGNGLINTEQFLGVADSDPLYYVVTGLYYDPITNTEIETPYSQEVLGAPLVLDTTVRDLPSRTREQIVQDYVDSIIRVNSEVSLIPGSVARDVDIDPFASEASRIWFMLDFVHRSQSFLTLLAMDNVSGDGVSDQVASSAYKQALKAALGLANDVAVQGLIDQQFDKLAANVNKYRLSGRQAQGSLILFTTTRPSRDILVPAGSFAISTADASTGVSAQRFRIGGSYILPAANAEAFYNFNERRYEIRVQIIAETTGSDGNVPPKSIQTLVGVSGLQAVNDLATSFGSDLESNAELASRALLGFSSVDTGTEGGYAAAAAAKIGIVRNKIIKSGDPLMMRDYDPVRNKHIGGKVDVWIQGVQERQVQDTFAFTFDVAQNVQAQVLEVTPSFIRMQVLDSRVTVESPIIEILHGAPGLGVRNVTQGADYDLTNVQILDYNTFRIDNTLPSQPATTLDDTVIADYRFQVVNQLFMTVQPVRRVVSVVGEISGALTPGVHYKLYQTEDPLLEGQSTLAKDHVSITPSGGIPNGNTILVNDELHVMIGFEPEPLTSIGVNTATIRVFSEDRSVEYHPPSSSSPDFDIIAGTPTTPVKIVRTSSSQIANGQEVSIDYSHDENFTVTYVVNDLLQQLQAIYNIKRHVTADVLVKQAIVNLIDVESTVQLKVGAKKERTDPLLRNKVSLDLSRKLIGQGEAQSNMDAAINDTSGVDFNVLPMARMAYADGSIKLRQPVLPTYVRVASLDIGGNQAYLLTNALPYPTTDGGGLDVEHKGVFQDDVVMSLAADLSLVGNQTNQAYIIGYNGAVITGYSDDAFLGSEGFLPIQYEAERLRRTANHVVVSLSSAASPPDVPIKHEYAVSYVIRGDQGTHDIDASAVEILDMGDLTITYREAK